VYDYLRAHGGMCDKGLMEEDEWLKLFLWGRCSRIFCRFFSMPIVKNALCNRLTPIFIFHNVLIKKSTYRGNEQIGINSIDQGA
jgi:hypothetical protein